MTPAAAAATAAAAAPCRPIRAAAAPARKSRPSSAPLGRPPLLLPALFLLLTVLSPLPTPATCQVLDTIGSSSTNKDKNSNDRKTNEDFMVSESNLAVGLAPFQLRLFAKVGSNLDLTDQSITNVRKVTQRYLDDKMRALYSDQGYNFDYVRLKVLDSTSVARVASAGGGDRRFLADDYEEGRALRGGRAVAARILQQDDTGMAITLGGGIHFAELPIPQQWKVGADFLSMVRQYDDLADMLTSSSDTDPALSQIDSVEVKIVSVAPDNGEENVEGGKEKLPSWMDEFKPESQDKTNEETASMGQDKEEDGKQSNILNVPVPAPDWGDAVGENDGDTALVENPKEYPGGAAVSVEKGDAAGTPSTASSSPSNTATIVISILSALLGIAVITALTLLYIKRRKARTKERDSNWSVREVGKYESVDTPKAVSSPAAPDNSGDGFDIDGKVIIANDTEDTSPGTTRSSHRGSPTASSSPPPAEVGGTQSISGTATTTPLKHASLAGTDAVVTTAVASGSRQVRTPRPENTSLPRHASFCSASSGGTEALAEATGIARGGASGTGHKGSSNASSAAAKRGGAVIKMRSLVSGVSQPRSNGDQRPPIVPSSGPGDKTPVKLTAAAPLSSSAEAYLSSAGSVGSHPRTSLSAMSMEEPQDGRDTGRTEGANGSVSRGEKAVASASNSVASSSRPPQHMGPFAGAFPTAAPGSHYVRRSSIRSGASSSYQTSIGGEPHHAGAYPVSSQMYNDDLHPLDWSCRGSDTELEDGEGHSVSNSTLSEHPSHAEGAMYPVMPASLLGRGFDGEAGARETTEHAVVTPSYGNHQDENGEGLISGNLGSPRTMETPSHDPTSPSAGTMTSGVSSSDRSGGEANQLIRDLLWLEGKIADVREAKGKGGEGADGLDSSNQNHTALYSPIGKAPTRDPYKDRVAKRRKDTRSIVCRDCYAPPGKLHIVIHTTKDGPAVHSIREGSALEGHLFPEDLIVAVDDIDTTSCTAEEVIKALAARVDSERKITVLHFDDQ